MRKQNEQIIFLNRLLEDLKECFRTAVPMPMGGIDMERLEQAEDALAVLEVSLIPDNK